MDEDNVMQFVSVAQDMVDLYKKKNADYGNSFGKTFEQLGLISAVTRISDKYNRIVRLATSGKSNVDESIEDTLIDMAAYSIMTIIELKKQRNHGNQET